MNTTEKSIVIVVAVAFILLLFKLISSTIASLTSEDAVELLVLAVIATIISYYAYNSAYKDNKCKKTELECKQAKEKLRLNSENSVLREEMLEAARKYYAARRKDGILTIYDEQAITNDLMSIIGTQK